MRRAQLEAVAEAEQQTVARNTSTGGALGPAPCPIGCRAGAATAVLADGQARRCTASAAVPMWSIRAMLRLATDRRAARRATAGTCRRRSRRGGRAIAARYEIALREVLHAEAALNALSDVTLVAGLLRAGEAVRLLRKNGTTGRAGPLITKADLADIKQRAAAFLKALDRRRRNPLDQENTMTESTSSQEAADLRAS